MKKYATISLLLVVALMSAACSALAPAEPTAIPTQVPPTATQEPSPTPSPIPTETPVPAPTLLPTVAPVEASAAGVLKPQDFSITPPATIGTTDWTQVPGTPYDPNIPASLNGMPPHLLVSFDQDQVDPSMFNINQRQGRVLPVQAYLSMYAQAGVSLVQERMQALQKLLAERPAEVVGDIPVLPGINAAQSLHAKVKYIDFTGGSGVAFLASYSQDVSPVTNERLQYFFQGLSSDGQQYISVVYPVASKYLPNTAAEVPPETMTALQTDPEKYLADTATALEQTAPTDFTPDLNSLDAMFKSIRIGALPPTSTPVPAGPNLAGTSWYWRSFVKADGSQTTITEYDNYMLEFLAGGQVKILADCNKGSGTYQTSGTQITIQVTATTQASCPADSLGDQFISGLNASYAYAVQSGVLALFSNAGTMNLGPTVVVVGTGTPIPAKGPVGPLWFWISFQGSDGTSVAPDDPDRYSLQLLPDGTAQMKADCNNATGTYNLSGSSLTIDVTSITDNKCKEGSLSQQYLNYLESAASFVLDGSNLSIALAADAGVMRFVK